MLNNAGQTEVSQLHDPILEEDIFRLDVSMKDIFALHIRPCRNKLLGEGEDLRDFDGEAIFGDIGEKTSIRAVL